MDLLLFMLILIWPSVAVIFCWTWVHITRLKLGKEKEVKPKEDNITVKAWKENEKKEQNGKSEE